MITPIQAATILFKLINVPDVKNSITGTVQKLKRKTVSEGQEKQDIVIIPLPTVPGGLQEGYLNVNIHVKDFEEPINSVNNLIPDSETLDRISAVVIPLIDDVMSENVLFWITNITLFEDTDLEEHYLNLKVRFGHPNY